MLNIHRIITINKFEYGDSSITSDGEGEFKFATREGLVIRIVAEGV
jgi:hypothetical protein